LLYEDLRKHIARGQAPDQFNSERLNSNDLRHFRAILKEISGQPREDVLTYLRDKDEITLKGIQQAMRQINLPFAQRVEDDTGVAIIVAIITNRADAEILIDALYFSDMHPLTFVTLDSADITQKRNQIIRAIRNYLLPEDTEILPLKIRHLGEIV
jgi:hypothetical protein